MSVHSTALVTVDDHGNDAARVNGQSVQRARADGHSVQHAYRLLQNAAMARRLFVHPPANLHLEGSADMQEQPPAPPPSDDYLEEFRSDVRTWLELDNSIRRLQAALKERRAARKAISNRVLSFMDRYSIDDLTTRECVLRYKVSYVRVPLSQSVIKERISTYFESNKTVAHALNGTLFGNRERKEKTALVRAPLPR
jgi:hypothetical protein